MNERTCEWCSEPYVPKRRDQRTCSAVCRKRHNNAEQNARHHVTPVPRRCRDCGGLFQPKRSDAYSCSAACYRRSTRPPKRHDKVCPQCGETFAAARIDRITCSSRCLTRAYRAANPGDHRIRASEYGRRRAQWIAEHQGRVSAQDWQRQQQRQQGRCYYCNDVTPRMEMDHVIPLSRGGCHRIGNVVLACPTCNNSKGRRLLSEWRYRHGGRVTV